MLGQKRFLGTIVFTLRSSFTLIAAVPGPCRALIQQQQDNAIVTAGQGGVFLFSTTIPQQTKIQAKKTGKIRPVRQMRA
jgi:hypothetical protein